MRAARERQFSFLKHSVLIVGAGPAGLAAAHELLSRGAGRYDVTVLEASHELGGISRTVAHGDLRMDIGGHRFFSKEPRVTKWWHERMPLQGAPAKDDIALGREVPLAAGGPDPEACDRVMLRRRRLSRIYYEHALFDYPLSLTTATMRQLGAGRMAKVAASYLAARARPLPEDSLENFYINRFGRTLYEIFFEGYTEKLWGRHPREIDAAWGAQRVKGLSVAAVVAEALAGRRGSASENGTGAAARDVETSLIHSFEYPKLGPGQLWEQAACEIEEMGGRIEFGKRVCAVKGGMPGGDAARHIAAGNRGGTPPLDTNAGAGAAGHNAASSAGAPVTLLCDDGSSYAADFIISSMPLKDLVAAMDDVPGRIAQIAADLPYRDFLTVGMLVDKLALPPKPGACGLGGLVGDNWIYMQDTQVKLGRVQIFNNWSPYLLPDPARTAWLGLEYFCDEGDELWSACDAHIVARAHAELVRTGILAPDAPVLDSRIVRVPKAYPAYFDSYAHIDELVAWLDTHPWLFCVGRNGQHRYNNMDHSMMTGFLTADALLEPAPSARPDARARIWAVNTESSYQEKA